MLDATAASSSRCRRRILSQVKVTWNGGYRAAVAVDNWVSSARVTLHFRDKYELRLLNAWGASIKGVHVGGQGEETSTSVFELVRAPLFGRS